MCLKRITLTSGLYLFVSSCVHRWPVPRDMAGTRVCEGVFVRECLCACVFVYADHLSPPHPSEG